MLHELVALQDLLLYGLVELREVQVGLRVVPPDYVQAVRHGREEQPEDVEDPVEIWKVAGVRPVRLRLFVRCHSFEDIDYRRQPNQI